MSYTNVNITKGATAQTIKDAVAMTKQLREETEVFKNSVEANKAITDTNASTSTANANIANTKAIEASVSASNANASSVSALSYSNSASTSASNALDSENNAKVSETSANNSASLASSKASEASTYLISTQTNADIASAKAASATLSEANAKASEIAANASSGSASNYATSASNSASLALTYSDNASISANNAAASVNSIYNNTTVATDAANTATNQANIATTKANEANVSANNALTYKNQIQAYVIPAGTSYSVDQINTQNSAMTKAQFNALAEERKANRAGSGFDEFGKHYSSTTETPVNNGLIATSTFSNGFTIGRRLSDGLGISKTKDPYFCISGVVSRLIGTNITDTSIRSAEIILPTAPNIYPYDTVLTAEQIASGVIKHADASNSGLIVNGKFYTDTSMWTAASSTLTADTGRIKITSTVITDFYAYQTLTTVIGKQYTVEFDFEKISYNGYVKIGGGVNQITNGSISVTTTGRYTLTFTATLATTYITLVGVNTGAVGQIVYFDNITVYPADAISRSDLVFLESWHEDISEKNFVYPLGNIQYLGANTDGLTGIANGSFTGFETYSLFGNWQTPSALIGKGYVWSSLTEAQRKAFIANPENNCYLDGDKTIQVRYRVRVLMGEDTNSMARATVQGKAVVPSTVLFTAPVTAVDAGLHSNTSDTYTYTGTSTNAISIATVSRRNQGMYHPVYNPNGSKKASDGNFWYNTAVSFTSISDCFDPAKLLTASGYIGTVSGRPDGLFYDQVHESDILDLRNSSKKVEDYNRLISREFNKLVGGTTRGKQGELYTEIKTQTTTGTVATVEVNDGTKYKSGDVVYIYDLTASAVKGRFVIKTISSNTLTVDTAFAKLANSYMISGASSTRTKSNTLLVCDVIGNPSNYPTAWKESGIFGTPLIVGENGENYLDTVTYPTLNTIKLSRKVSASNVLSILKSSDNGVTWTTVANTTVNTTSNKSGSTESISNSLVMVYYQTHTSMAVPVVNSEVVEYGDVNIIQHSNIDQGVHLGSTLTGKVNVSTLAFNINAGKPYNFNILSSTNKILTSPYNLSVVNANTISPAVKVFPYLTRLNGKAYLNLVFKEMKHNGTSWGDDSKFNIVDNVSTTTDLNAQTVLIGQKTVELPYFIGADE